MSKKEKVANAIFYGNYKEMIYQGTPEQVKEIMVAYCQYAFDDIDPQVSPQIAMLWGIIKSNIDSDKEQYRARCEQNRANARKRYEDRTNETITYTLNGHDYDITFPTENKSNIFNEDTFKILFSETEEENGNERHQHIKSLIDKGNKDKWSKPYEIYENEVWEEIYKGAN